MLSTKKNNELYVNTVIGRRLQETFLQSHSNEKSRRCSTAVYIRETKPTTTRTYHLRQTGWLITKHKNATKKSAHWHLEKLQSSYMTDRNMK